MIYEPPTFRHNHFCSKTVKTTPKVAGLEEDSDEMKSFFGVNLLFYCRLAREDGVDGEAAIHSGISRER